MNCNTSYAIQRKLFLIIVVLHFVTCFIVLKQIARLEECRKLLIALSIGGILNDQSVCLQAVIFCYGLLAPLLQMEIHLKPVLQVRVCVSYFRIMLLLVC